MFDNEGQLRNDAHSLFLFPFLGGERENQADFLELGRLRHRHGWKMFSGQRAGTGVWEGCPSFFLHRNFFCGLEGRLMDPLSPLSPFGRILTPVPSPRSREAPNLPTLHLCVSKRGLLCISVPRAEMVQEG